MATVEELLETQNSILEEIDQSIDNIEADSDLNTTNIQTMESSIAEIQTDMSIIEENITNETGVIFNNLESMKASLGEYTTEEVRDNNQYMYEDIKAIRESLNYYFIFMGVFLAFIMVWVIVKGFFRNVSN